MSLYASKKRPGETSITDVMPVFPVAEVMLQVGEWWSLNIDEAATAVAATGCIAMDASKARDSFELWTMMPAALASAATVFQRYVSRIFQLSEDAQLEIAAATVPFAQRIERMVAMPHFPARGL